MNSTEMINKRDLVKRTKDTKYEIGKYYKTNDVLTDKGFVFRCEGTGSTTSLNLVQVTYARQEN